MKYKPNTHRNTIHSTKLMHTLQGPEGDKNSSHSHRVSEWWTDVRKKKNRKIPTSRWYWYIRRAWRNHYQAELSGQRHEVQVPREDLPVLPAHQGIRDDWLFLQYPFKMRVKTAYQPTHAGLWTRLKALSIFPGCKVLQGSSHCIQRAIILDTFSIILMGRSY